MSVFVFLAQQAKFCSFRGRRVRGEVVVLILRGARGAILFTVICVHTIDASLVFLHLSVLFVAFSFASSGWHLLPLSHHFILSC